MEKYEMISLEQAKTLSAEQFVEKYNAAVEMIWYLTRRLGEEMDENDNLWFAYEEVADKLFG